MEDTQTRDGESEDCGLSLGTLVGLLKDKDFCYRRICAEIELYENRLETMKYVGSSFRVFQERGPESAKALIPKVLKVRRDMEQAESYLRKLRVAQTFLYGAMNANPGVN